MVIIDEIKLLSHIHKMIMEKRTGTPDEFAESLCISRRKMYNIIEYIEGLGADIIYSREQRTFIYTNRFDMEIMFHVRNVSNEEWVDICGYTNLYY